MRWRRERNMRWTQFSDVDPAIVHLAYAPADLKDPGRAMRASPCTQMTLLGQSYGETTDEPANCVACLGAEDYSNDFNRDRSGYP